MQCSQGTFLELGSSHSQSASHWEAHPAQLVSTTERWCVQELGAVNSLDMWHMAHSSNAVVQFLPAGTSFRQVHFCSGIEGTRGRLCKSVKSNSEPKQRQSSRREAHRPGRKGNFANWLQKLRKRVEWKYGHWPVNLLLQARKPHESAHRLTLGASLKCFLYPIPHSTGVYRTFQKSQAHVLISPSFVHDVNVIWTSIRDLTWEQAKVNTPASQLPAFSGC